MVAVPVGSRLRDARKKKRLTQSKLAELVGISVSYLNLIEHNKRAIGGGLLNRLARELELDVSRLSGQEDARLMQQLGELTSDPLLHELSLSEKGAQSVASRHPDWARAMIRVHDAMRSSGELVEALSDQMNRDPHVLETSHEILTRITSIRSLAEILDDHVDLPEQRRKRFLSVLVEESEKLSGSARSLFDFMSERDPISQPSTPAGEVDDFIIDNNNFFPDLESEATRLFERIQNNGIIDERLLIEELTNQCGLTVSFDYSVRKPAVGRPESLHFHLDAKQKLLVLNASLSQSTLRFQLARILFGQMCHETIDRLVKTEALTTSEARERAFHALARYGAGALVLPYAPFLEAADELRYDVQILMARFGASFEQVCHRLVTLRKPGAAAVPFAFMRTDLAGNTTKRFSLPDLRLPRHGSACPLWAIYRAFLTPDHITTQLVRLPDDRQFLIIARAIAKEPRAFGESPQTYSIMLACNAAHADRIVYGDTYVSRDASIITEAGVNCRLCPRSNCPQRAYAQILPPSAGKTQ